ncbi:MAG: Anaerobic sulfite reductase subunit A [bacterium ADurb.Bin212]|nr:MAG: Anaerobic sulfite reductase subunit A [bacterium ADurb.Bin212]
MLYKANNHHLDLVAEVINKKYQIFSHHKNGSVFKYQRNQSPKNISWHSQKSILPFKKIIFPEGLNLDKDNQKVALTGLALCDIAALNLFLKQFSESGIIQKREELLIVGGDCSPDENCFCDQFNLDPLLDFDLFISKRENEYLVYSKSWRGENIIKKIGLKKSLVSFNLKAKAKSPKIDLELTKKNIDNRELTKDYWQKISNNCFGCGACTAVCPLCFCFDQNFLNSPDGGCKRCLNWTSCFASDFSQIQFGHDLRPENTDRLYNWYHHKFVRGPKELKSPLCVGCGRCITACPAHLNIKNIISSMNNKFPVDN